MGENKQHEIKKLEEMLRIPISHMVIADNYARLSSGGKYIGKLPTGIAGGIRQYQAHSFEKSTLDWHNVYTQHQNKIDDLNRKDLKDESVVMIPIKYGEISVRDSENKHIALYAYYYEKKEWHVIKLKSD